MLSSTAVDEEIEVRISCDWQKSHNNLLSELGLDNPRECPRAFDPSDKIFCCSKDGGNSIYCCGASEFGKDGCFPARLHDSHADQEVSQHVLSTRMLTRKCLESDASLLLRVKNRRLIGVADWLAVRAKPSLSTVRPHVQDTDQTKYPFAFPPQDWVPGDRDHRSRGRLCDVGLLCVLYLLPLLPALQATPPRDSLWQYVSYYMWNTVHNIHCCHWTKMNTVHNIHFCHWTEMNTVHTLHFCYWNGRNTVHTLHFCYWHGRNTVHNIHCCHWTEMNTVHYFTLLLLEWEEHSPQYTLLPLDREEHSSHLTLLSVDREEHSLHFTLLPLDREEHIWICGSQT
uniref:Uncharacterized protein n=1 Tax=Timema bartmani TaxID=61472 RepID=A0A7R9I687_9NEOP|nr:unnamed protein product [Timema bartmani]